MQSLIPEMSEYDWIDDLTPLGWLQHAGSIGQALAYSDLFWPDFIEHDGCILRADRYREEIYQKWLKSTKGDRAAVEAVINHVHLTDLFPYQKYDVTDKQLERLGMVIKETWQAKLDRDFPGRCYVSFSRHSPTHDGFEITVMQPRHPRPDR